MYRKDNGEVLRRGAKKAVRTDGVGSRWDSRFCHDCDVTEAEAPAQLSLDWLIQDRQDCLSQALLLTITRLYDD